ncbi:pitrilysin family protein [soil metagenome]
MDRTVKDRVGPPAAGRAVMDRSRPPEPGPIRTFEFPPVEQRTLPNGLTLLTAHSGDLPLVTVRAVLDAGATAERAGEEGLAQLTTQALEGGTLHRTGDELAWAVERLGAELETHTTWDAVHVAFTTRSDNLADALALLAEIVTTPGFPAREVDRLRDEQLAEMLRRRTEPRGLADDSAAHFIFADDSTYARPLIGLEPRVRGFSRDDVVAWHQRQFTPGNAAIIVVGRVDPDEAESHVQRAFGDWTGVSQPTPGALAGARSDRAAIHVVDRASAVQSELRIGHVGVPRHHEDYYTLLVLNGIIAGAFTSRLNLSLREKHGFTYGVRSAFAFRRAAGPFLIQTAVASDVTARAVEETLRELHSIRDEGVTDEEVSAARDFIAGTLPLELQTTAQLSSRLAEIHTFGLGTDYFEGYRRHIAAVTRDDVMRAARTHVRPDALAIVIVGNADVVVDDLKKLDAGDVVRHNAGDSHASDTPDVAS